MAKVIIQKGKKIYIPDLDREVTVIKEKQYYVEDTTRDFHTQYGAVTKADLEKPDGTSIKSAKGKEFSIFSPSFIDNYRRIRRLAQIIPLKDIGFILCETGAGKTSKVVDAGTGSGALALFLAHHVKKVTSYDVVQEHHRIGKENAAKLGLKNVTFKMGNVYAGIKERGIDLITFDLPEPWKALDHAEKSLKPGGFLVSYSPSIPQTQDFVNAVLAHDRFIHIKTIEMIERAWEVKGRKVRPQSKAIIHSGFLSLCRRI